MPQILIQNRVRMSQRSQNGRQLPFARLTPGDFDSLSDDELEKIANGCHQQFAGCMRSAIKDYARVAGAALNVMKARVKHGHWTSWLRKHFEGSVETARVYRRIAQRWSEIEANGWDQKTLDQLRRLLADPPAEMPEFNSEEDDADDPATQEAAEVTDDGGMGQSPPDAPKPVPLYFNEAGKANFDELIAYIEKYLGDGDGEPSKTDTVVSSLWVAKRDLEEVETQTTRMIVEFKAEIADVNWTPKSQFIGDLATEFSSKGANQ